MKLINWLYPALALFPHVLAQSPVWGQCGGIGWSGPTKCATGSVCVYLGPYHSQCLPESQVSVSTTPTPTVQPTSTTTVSTSNTCAFNYPRATGPPIAALDGWAAGSYLQKAQGSDAAILGPSSSRGWFMPGGSIRMIYSSSSLCIRYFYLNIKAADTSYKPLALESVGTTSDWKYDGPNGTISTGAGSSTFITCSGGSLYIQTGSDFPSGNCTTTRLKVQY